MNHIFLFSFHQAIAFSFLSSSYTPLRLTDRDLHRSDGD